MSRISAVEISKTWEVWKRQISKTFALPYRKIKIIDCILFRGAKPGGLCRELEVPLSATAENSLSKAIPTSLRLYERLPDNIGGSRARRINCVAILSSRMRWFLCTFVKEIDSLPSAVSQKVSYHT
ncbi:uncharacterized protein PHALS_07189 [Plasmopara halstedii]|uniref:Uncharacterized protein n=1 Tax=Plasmopara halstedii TaxID=4781 RepID=A0A0P1B5V9_PLAHL|nr:uncharacterized protein PHALS_07189 [Plasmopara halstedii]CEG49425.1 hypothetical protein PHALS_07189 [Plasmopara halstedii]|eukprot:XP_024585794.1 hypothetical protein PHALS_07189 [Plasmopara halstedii]